MQDPANISPAPPSGGYPVDDGPPPPTGRNVIIAVVLLALFAGGLWYYLKGRAPEPPPPPPAEPLAVPDAGVAFVLPPMSERDFAARDALTGLSPLSEWQEWLAQQDLIGKFTAAVANIAEGESPRAALAFLAPKQPFEVVEKKRKIYAAPASFARYDTVTRVIDSIDADGAAFAYRKLKPLIDGVYAEISRPGAKFDDTFKAALDRMADVPLPDGETELVPKGALFAYADPKLEALSQAEKHLLRFGPKNANVVQQKARDLREKLFSGAAPSNANAGPPDGGR